jgi:hypothetical protein
MRQSLGLAAPTVRPAAEDEARVAARWSEYGLADL